MNADLNKYKQAGREAAEAFLKDRKAARDAGEEQAKAFSAEQKKRRADYLAELKTVDKTEKTARKRGFKAFRRRKNRLPRTVVLSAIAVLLVAAILFTLPTTTMLSRVLSSQKYTDDTYGADLARKSGDDLARAICDEGFVLLKNDDAVLPLQTKDICVFGDDAYNFVYGGSGSAGADQSDAMTLFEAFDNAGIRYDKDLNEAYRRLGVTAGGKSGGIGAMLKSYFTGAEELDDWTALDDETIAKAASGCDTALIVLSSQEVEGDEIDLGILQIMSLAMPNRMELVDKVCRAFEHVIFIINSGNVMELGFINDYESADAVLWVGAPGAQGPAAIADVLIGEVNPSGRTVDTWPLRITDEPSYQTYGDYGYDNLDAHAIEYSEGIYVGYRYYETRFVYEDEYWDNVLFPFGYGLSYTTFEQEVVYCDALAGNIDVIVNVTNTGTAAGKDVVEVYFQPPYYDGSSIEKSAIELAAYGKTGELQPGETEAVKLSFPVSELASYSTELESFLLENGYYFICIGSDVHDAVKSFDLYPQISPVDKEYGVDMTTLTGIHNIFSFAEGDTEFLSRDDWEGTFPESASGYTASRELLAAIAEYEEGTAEYVTEPTYGADNGLELIDLKGLSYGDELWERFLDEFTVKDMIRLTANGGWHTEQIKRLGVPETNLLDGPSGINSMFSDVNAVGYPMECVLGSTWNNDLAYRLGECVGTEAMAYGVDGWYAPAVNLHRSSIGGRNSEYFSEDPLICGKMAAAAIQGVQSKGVVAIVKHFVCNDTELNARSKLYTWVSEQALRELYLRPFEIAIKEGGAGGVMSSFTCLGCKWCGGSSELLENLLRGEWGFKGFVTTDACLGDWMDAKTAIENGNDLMLEMGLQTSQEKLAKAYSADPENVGNALREATHNICYAIVNYMEGAF